MNALIVFVGGGLGALVRYLLSLIMPKMSYLPLGTLIANFFGCFIATIVFIYFIDKFNSNSIYKVFWIVGFCGGLSTLSALSLELLDFIHNGELLRAFVYTFITILVCVVSVLLALIFMKLYFNIKF